QRGRLGKPRPDVDDAVADDEAEARPPADMEARKAHQVFAFSSKPARSRTASRRAASSGLAGIIGKRCSFFGMMPQRIIMYFIGIGFVSKNTALLISSSAS